MSKKQHISNPQTYQTKEPEAQKIEGVLLFAQDLKNKQISTVQHNKAELAMRKIDTAYTEFNKWYNSKMTDINNKESLGELVSDKEIQDLQNTRHIVDNLIIAQAGPGTDLGQWLHNDRNSSQQYQALMQEMNVDVNPAPQRLASQILPRRVAKAVDNIWSVGQFQMFNQRSPRTIKRSDTLSTDSTDSVKSDNNDDSSSKKSKF